MVSIAGDVQYEFLDGHAAVIEQLLPTVHAVAFFDARGNQLRGRRPVPLLEARSLVRAALEPAAPETSLAVNGSRCIAAFALYGEPRAGGRHRSARAVAGVCLIALKVANGVQSPSIESLREELDALLTCVGYHLVERARRAPVRAADQAARDLEWLLEITAHAIRTEGSPASQDRGEQLSNWIAASVTHLECLFGALLIPERHIRIVRTAQAERHAASPRRANSRMRSHAPSSPARARRITAVAAWRCIRTPTIRCFADDPISYSCAGYAMRCATIT